MNLLFIAVLVMHGGAIISAPMASKSACVEFTRAIALHVESADCYTTPDYDAIAD